MRFLVGTRRWVAAPRSRFVVIAAAVTIALLGSLAPAALADTYSTGSGTVCVGTNGSDAVSGGGCGLFPAVAVSQGGCARGTHVAVAVGESGRCTNGAEAYAPVTVGLLGADTETWDYTVASLAVSDSGYAHSTGNQELFDYAVSGTGNASGATAVSGTGTATGATAVSGTGNATGLAAVSGTGDASSGCTTVANVRVGPAVSGTGYANGCQSVSGALTWIDTPDGPVGVGAGIKTVQIVAKEIVAGAEDVLEETTAVGAGTAHSVPEMHPEDIDPDYPRDIPYHLDLPIGGAGALGGSYGGCPQSTSCNGIHITQAHTLPIDVWNEYIHMYEGALVGSYLIPDSRTNDGYNWDSFHIYATLTGYGAAICGLNNWVSSDGGTNAFHAMQPSGSRDVGDHSSQSFGLSVGPFGYSTSWSSRSGRIQGVFSTEKAKATGSWTYRGRTCPNDSQHGASAAMTSGATYRWPRNAGRSYNFGLWLTYQDMSV